MKKNTHRTLAVLTACAFLAACATPQGPGGGQQAGAVDPCNVGQSALMGAAVGALLGGLTDGTRGAISGAAIGTGIAAIACAAMNWRSEQTKTAEQAERDFLRANAALPAQPAVVSYTSRLQSGVAQRGRPMQVASTLELVNGSTARINEVQEKLVVYSPDGTPFRTGGKPFTATTAGRFENSFELTLPQGAPQGVYGLKTKVYVNGNQVAIRNLSAQVVWDGTSGIVVASR